MAGNYRACIQKMYGVLRPELVIFLHFLGWLWILFKGLMTLWRWPITTLTIALCISIILTCVMAWHSNKTFAKTLEEMTTQAIEGKLQEYVDDLERVSMKKLEEKEADIKQLKDKIKEKEKKIETLEEQLRQQQNTENLQQEIDTYKKEIGELQKEIVRLENKVKGNMEIISEMRKKSKNSSSSPMANLIRDMFEKRVIASTLIPVLQKYDLGILTSKDVEEVTAVQDTKGKCRAASTLLNLLCRYEGWLPCLVKALRDPDVKQASLANDVEFALGQAKEEKKRDYLKSARNSQGEHQMEFGFQHEIDTRKRNIPCENEAKHDTLVEVKHFQLELLPKTWRFKAISDLIKAAGCLTVKVASKYISDRRPHGYLLYSLGGLCGLVRTGCGMVWTIKRKFSTQDISVTPGCPCRECLKVKVKDDKSHEKRKQWGEFVMFTDRHLIYDDDETYFTTLTVSFENGDGNVKTEQLFPVSCQPIEEDDDYVEITCVTHDEQVAKKLENILKEYDNSCKEMGKKIGQSSRNQLRETMNKCIIIFYLHGLKKCVSVGDKTDSDPLSYRALTCPGSSGAPVLVLGDCLEQGKYVSTTTHCTYNKASGIGQSCTWRR